MILNRRLLPCVVALLSTATVGRQASAQATPGFNNKIPAKILTPDTVRTPIGTLGFFDGMPSKATVQKVYDNLDQMRGVETFLNGMPAASVEAIRLGLADEGVDGYNKVGIADHLLDSDPLLLTGNTETVYVIAMFNLKADGPMVVEVPPGSGPGTLDDAFFRFVVDMGAPGPDRGKGGKYLILPPDYQGEINQAAGGATTTVAGEQYFVARSTSYENLVIIRGFLIDGKTDAPNAMFKTGLKIHPLARDVSPRPMEFVSISKRVFNTVHANSYAFYDELHTVIDREPVSMLDPELRGLFAAVGIEKGKPFAPDARMKKILTDAVAIGNATARAIAFRPRLEGVYLYPNSAWYTGFVGGDYQWLKDGGTGGRNLDARTLFFYIATVNTPAMAAKMIGLGSQYAVASADRDGKYLDGGKSYKLNIPANPPAKNFWSVVVYDPQTRSELQTSQPYPSKNNNKPGLIKNADGSVYLYFGPTAPEGKEANWTQTVKGKAWFVLFRLYGPLEPWFDKTWRPGEFELMK